MTILFAGGEDTSVTLVGGASVLTNTLYFRTAFARAALYVPGNSTAADPNPERVTTPTFTPTSTIWVHGQFYDTLTTFTNQQSVIIRSPDGVSRIVVRQSATQGLLKVCSRNAAGTITDLATATSPWVSSTLTAFDLFVNYAAGGGIQLYIAGVLVVNYSGDPRTDAATTLNQVEFAALGNSQTMWSEIIIADQDTRPMSLWTMAPQASGNTQAWTPNTLANINKATISDTTFITSASAGQYSEWTAPAAGSLPAGTWTVLGLVQNARVQGGSSAPQHYDWVVRTGATDYLAGALVTPPVGSFGNAMHTWATNPNTGVAWTTTDITAVGFNTGIQSQT